ncbi:Glucosidase [Nostocoides japonicum T1-X7]|uniref:Glucosidase n=1 Tax=Nostocoides japonicum T1-X7 TaxID=1194083 RepID=A0A077LVE9_9MICO|nr:6-phospho-beta-glucosidase [Tetrasphaera japonica]CCH77908.1 Glucosidase [Tetrasphaera japonica T1-X7]
MRLCIVGGGGFRTPHVWQAVLRRSRTAWVDEVVLHDVDPHRLAVIEAVLTSQAARHPDPPRLVTTTDLREAVAGSDAVFAAVRVGGLDGRCTDEHVALDLGVLGQETTGPGGIAYALRTVPVMVRLAELMRELAPTAYLLNFTNPAGIITEATSAVLGDRVVGICDTPSGLGRAVVRALGADPVTVAFDYVGLNHLGWMRRVLIDGDDVLPALLADDALLGRLEETAMFGADWLRTLGCLPNEYLYYYDFTREAVASIRAAGRTRGDFLKATQEEFYRTALAGPDPAAYWREVGAWRNANYMAEARGAAQGEGGRETEDPDGSEEDEGYAGVAVSVMAAMTLGEPATHILNVRNRGTVDGFDDDAVVEIPVRVDGSGVHPLPLPSQPDLHQRGLMEQIKAVERHAIAAATTGDRSEALRAFALHPLVDSVTVARTLLDHYIAALPDLAAILR